MCHSHFEIDFNPRINFISGCNGSGKSAIQTGIVIGLGGIASKTNRSSKIDGKVLCIIRRFSSPWQSN